MARNWYRGQGNPNNKCGENGTEAGNRKHGKTMTLIRAHISGDEPCPAVKHLTEAISDWAVDHIGECTGQRKHNHIYNRMVKFNFLLSNKLNNRGHECQVSTGLNGKGNKLPPAGI